MPNQLLNTRFLTLIEHSTNGTFINDKRLGKGKQVQLKDGDIISMPFPSSKIGVYSNKNKFYFFIITFNNSSQEENHIFEFHLKDNYSDSEQETQEINVENQPTLQAKFSFEQTNEEKYNLQRENSEPKLEKDIDETNADQETNTDSKTSPNISESERDENKENLENSVKEGDEYKDEVMEEKEESEEENKDYVSKQEKASELNLQLDEFIRSDHNTPTDVSIPNDDMTDDKEPAKAGEKRLRVIAFFFL